MQSHVAASPTFQVGPVSRELLDELVRAYEEITGDLVRGPRNNKRNLIAACYRVHGDDFIPFVGDYFRVEQSAQNLLGVLRRAVPRLPSSDKGDADFEALPQRAAPRRETTSEDRSGHHGPPCPADLVLPNLIYCADHLPQFDPTSTRRWDRPNSGHGAAPAWDGSAR